MKDRVAGVLPALVHEAAVAPPPVLDEAIAVRIAVLVDPFQRRQDVGPDRIQRGAVGGVLPVQAGEHDEQRRRVDGAVVATERHFAQRGELALARLVQDLAGLGVA